MLMQTNSYVVPKDKRSEHARLLRRFRQTLAKLGCDQFEVYEQVSQNWGGQDSGGRFVQIMRFRDRRHQMEVQTAERTDPAAQALVQEFCELINFPFQQQQGMFAVGFYTSILSTVAQREPLGAGAGNEEEADNVDEEAGAQAPPGDPGTAGVGAAAAEAFGQPRATRDPVVSVATDLAGQDDQPEDPDSNSVSESADPAMAREDSEAPAVKLFDPPESPASVARRNAERAGNRQHNPLRR